jgi:hypothetical protein
MNAQNVGITWCMLGYGAESPWLLRDCLLDGASAIWPDMPESLPAALAALPAGVNAVVVVALPTAPHLAELLQALRAHGYLLIVATTTMTPTATLSERVLTNCEGAHGVAWVREADMLRHELAPTWHNIPHMVATVVHAIVMMHMSDGMIVVDTHDVLHLLHERPMLAIGQIAYELSAGAEDADVARHVETLFACPLLAELRTSTHFLINVLGGDEFSLTHGLALANAFEARVVDDANIIWNLQCDPQATMVQVVVMAFHPR